MKIEKSPKRKLETTTETLNVRPDGAKAHKSTNIFEKAVRKSVLFHQTLSRKNKFCFLPCIEMRGFTIVYIYIYICIYIFIYYFVVMCLYIYIYT